MKTPLCRVTTRTLNRIAPLEVDALIADALRRSAQRDFADYSFVGPLEMLLRGVKDEARLSLFGHLAVRFDALRCLTNVLRLEREEKRDPAILRRPIERPIVITGLPRSGTTFLHSLLALDPAIAVPRIWQLIYPYPIRQVHSSRDSRLARVERQLAFFRLLSPGLSGMHPMTAESPQECTDITAHVFQSLRFDTIYRIPSYREWLDRHGHHIAYRFHRRFLQHLDAQGPSGRQWVLKCPDHVFALDALRDAYPDAHIVMVHRDPLSVLASVAKLTEILRRPFSRHLDRVQIGREISERWAQGAELMMATHAHDRTILHVRYPELMADPLHLVRRLYAHWGMTLSAQAIERMAECVRKSPRGGYAVHHHSLEAYGLAAPALRERFQPYMDLFGVWPEGRPATPAIASAASPV